MATRYAKELLRAEIIAALKTSPCVSLLNTTSPNVGVYSNDVLDGREHIDPSINTCILVSMPEVVDSESLTENLTRYTYEADLFVYQSEDTHATADTDMGQLLHAMRSSMTAYTSNGLKLLGIPRNGITLDDVEWGELGQDQCYRVRARAVCVYCPSTTMTL